MSDAVALIYDQRMLHHKPGRGHPERPARLRTIIDALQSGAVDGVSWHAPEPVTREAIERVHDPAHVEALLALRGRRGRLDPDTPVSLGTIDAALLSAGAVVRAVELVCDGRVARRAFSLGRPPGHHAERGQSMGFCLLNNAAIGAAHALATGAAERVLILDWDVHHGNGTQDIFRSRGDVLLIDVHQSPLYPGTGAIEEVGEGEGRGTTINVPLPGGCGDAAYRLVMNEIVRPAADAFRPDLVMISAGFDAHREDPLGGMRLTEAGYDVMTSAMMEIAETHAGGRLVAVLEGGYNVEALSRCVRRCVERLVAGVGAVEASPVAREDGEPDVGPIVEAVRRTHGSGRSEAAEPRSVMRQ